MKKVKLNKSSIEIVLLAIIIILAEKCFYLIDINKISVPGLFNYYDLSLGVAIIWSIYIMIKYKHIQVNYKFKYNMLFCIILIIISSIRSQQLYSQNFSLGVRPQRFFLIFSIMYFPLLKFTSIKDNKKKLETLLYTLGITEIIIFIIQYIVISKVKFLYVIQSIRYGGVRLHFEAVLLSVLFFMAVNNFLKKKNIYKNLIIIIVLLLYNLLIIRGRLAVAAIFATGFIILLFWKKNRFIKYFLITYILVFGFVLLNTSIIGEYMNSLNKSNIQSDFTAQIRENGKEFYLNQIKESPILGRGYINELNENASKASGIQYNYLLVDNGIVAFLFMYGVIGVAWVVILFVKIYIYSLRDYLKNNNYFGLAYIIYLTIIMPNILEFYWKYGPLYLGIMIVLVEISVDKKIYNNDERTSDNEVWNSNTKLQ